MTQIKAEQHAAFEAPVQPRERTSGMTTIRMESRRNMTDGWLRNLKDTGRRTEYSDTLQKGLRLRVGAQGERTFLLKARGRDGRMATVTLGPYPMLSLKDARQKAMACLLALKNCEDPNAEKRAFGRRGAAGVAA